MARRTMTLRRIDPWSVLKFGFVVNLCAAVVFILGFAILWFVIGQLGIIDQACQLAEDVGFEDCGIDGGAVFTVVVLFAALAAVIMTGIAVFGAFLHNLLADLMGGIEVTFVEEGGATSVRRRERTVASGTTTTPQTTESGDRSVGRPPPRDQQETSRQEDRSETDRSERTQGSAGASGGGSGSSSGGGSGDDSVFGGRDQRRDQGGWQS